MDERSLDLLDLKKKILLPHLDFVEYMLKKVKGTHFEEKWKIMHECITSDKKRPSYEQIKKLEEAIVDLKNQSKQRNDINSAKQNLAQSQQPSTSKTIVPNNVSGKSDEINIERDPRRRVATFQNTIYKIKDELNVNQSPSTSGVQKNNTPPPPFIRNNSGPQKYQNRHQFSNRSFDNSIGGRFDRRHSKFPNEKTQERFQRNLNIRSRDDSHFKRKRSESPVKSHRGQNMPKRRFSCYESDKERSKTERKIEFDSEVIDNPNQVTNVHNPIEIDKNLSKNPITSKSANYEQASTSTKQVENETKRLSKRSIEKQPIESTDLADAVKKIHSFKIPKVGQGNKSNLGSKILQKETKDDAKTLENQRDCSSDKQKNKAIENDNTQKKSQQNNVVKDISKLENDVTNKDESLSKSNDAKPSGSKISESRKVDESKINDSKCDSEILPEVTKSIDIENSPIDKNVKISANSESSKVENEVVQKTENIKVDQTEENKPNQVDGCIETSPSCKKVEILDLNKELDSESEITPVNNGPGFEKEIIPQLTKNIDSAKDTLIGSLSENSESTSDDSKNNLNDVKKESEAQKTEGNSNPTKPTEILSSLLESADENPEKILEGSISALGADKVKKMQELLLKNPLKVDGDAEFSKGEASISSDDKSETKEDVHEKPIESSPVKPQKVEAIKETESNKIAITSKTSPTKAKIVKRKARQSELDKLHHDLLSGYDCEAILRASMQPRISSKTKHFDSSVSVPKIAKQRPSIDQNKPNENPAIKPFKLELVRLNLTAEDMPVIVNEEFINLHLNVGNTISRTKPRVIKEIVEEKVEVKSEPKPETIITEINPVTTGVKPESKLVINEEQPKLIGPSIEPAKPVHPQKISQPTKRANPNIKKKRKLLLWSKGILKKKTRRLYMNRISEDAWEDIESSDDEVNFVTVLKMNTFKDLFCEFASGYAKRKGFKRNQKNLKITNDKPVEAGADETEKDSVNPSESADILPETDEGIKSPIQKETIPKPLQVIPKRINLPLDKNFLTMISQSNTATAAKNLQTTDELKNKNSNITIKLPTVDKPNSTLSPTTSTRSLETRKESPDQIARVLPIQSTPNQSNVVIVKPYSNEAPENIRIRSLSSQEQEALITSLSAIKKTVVLNILPTQNKSFNIGSTSMQKLPVKADEVTANSLPMISNVVSINPSASSVKPNAVSDASKQLLNTAISKPNTTHEPNSAIRKHIVVQKSVPTNAYDLNISGNKLTVPGPRMIIEARKSVQKVSVDLPPLPKELSKNQQEVVDLVDDDNDDDFIDMLRPWIEKFEFKSRKQETEALKMINNTHCLASLFKCMSSTCCFYTNDKDLFKIHLELHRDHQSDDSSNFLLCCYCNFRPNSINLLIMHIESAHGYAKFCCRYCFYRSVNEYQVTANHHINYHRNKEKCVIVFAPMKSKNENTEKNYISETIPKVCPILQCPYCKNGFYTTAEFEKHILGHKESYSTHCNKCDVQTSKQQILQHLFSCYNKFGNFQCVFCVFGTCNFSLIDTHLSTLHPDKMSYFAERTLNFGKNPAFVESLTIKELSKKITGNVKKILLNYPFKDDVFRNDDGFGRLGEDLFFRQKSPNDPNTFIKMVRRKFPAPPVPSSSQSPSTSKSVLQINQVMSLHD